MAKYYAVKKGEERSVFFQLGKNVSRWSKGLKELCINHFHL